MKKMSLAAITAIFLLSNLFPAYAKVTEDIWYTYNGYSDFHNFSIQHPSNWKPKIISETVQAFSPEDDLEKGDYKLLIREFEGQSFEEAENYYVGSQVILLEESEVVFPASAEKLFARNVKYKDSSTQKEFVVTFIQRGSLILSFESTDETLQETVELIYKTFSFTDSWENYFDDALGYYFIYPTFLEMKPKENTLEFVDPQKASLPIFFLTVFQDKTVEQAIDTTESNTLDFSTREEIYLNSYHATSTEFFDESSKKSLSYIFLEYKGDTYRLSSTNVAENFPTSDYYKESIQEILASFRFPKLELKDGISPLNNLSDVSKSHPNYIAINYLFEKKVITGYADGSFKPDSPINRAELTKIIVAVTQTPDPTKYKNCFPDVKTQWFAPYICYAKEKGWVSGYNDGKFKPSNNISRMEAMKIVLLSLFDQEISSKATLKSPLPLDVDLSAWYGKYFIFAENSKLLDKTHIKKSGKSYYYYPNDNITRKEVAESIYRLMQIAP